MALRVENIESGSARTAWTTTPADFDILANDPFKGVYVGLLGGAGAEGRPCRQINVLGSGTLVYTGIDGVNVTLPAATVPWVFNVQAIKVLAAGTTATNVVIVW